MTPSMLRVRRWKLGLSQPELAAMLQVNPKTVSAWETGRQAAPGYLELALQRLEHNR